MIAYPFKEPSVKVEAYDARQVKITVTDGEFHSTSTYPADIPIGQVCRMAVSYMLRSKAQVSEGKWGEYV